MMKLNKRIKSSLILLAATGIASAVTVPLILHNHEVFRKDITDVQKKIFNIENGVLKGFRSTASAHDITKYVHDNGCFLLPRVKHIADGAFENITQSVTFNGTCKLVIPQNVETIGKRAFYNNTEISSIEYEQLSECHTINESAFAFCTNLTTLALPQSIYTTDTTKGIKDGAFFACSSLNKIDLTKLTPEEWKAPAWSFGAFEGVSKTGNMLFPFASGEAYIITRKKSGWIWAKLVYCGVDPHWVQCFKDGQAISEPYNIVPIDTLKFVADPNNPELLQLVGYRGSWAHKCFNWVLLPKNVGSINFATDSDNFFRNEAAPWIKKFDFSKTVITTIPNELCKGYQSALTPFSSIDLPTQTLTSYGDYCFQNCNLNNLALSYGFGSRITYIGKHAFDNAKANKIGFLNPNVVIGDCAFANIKNLSVINFDGFKSKTTNEPLIPEWTAKGLFANSGTEPTTGSTPTVNLCSIGNNVSQWRYWKKMSAYLTTKSLPSNWVYSPTSQLTIDDLFEVDSSGVCTGWAKDKDGKTITNEEILSVVGSGLSIHFPSTVKSIANYAFFDKTTQKSLIPDTIQTINFATNGTVTSIGDYAFADLPSSVQHLVFSEGTGESYKESNVSHIGNSAFRRIKIDALQLASTLTSISEYAFYGSTLRILRFPVFTKGLTIGNFAFAQDSPTMDNIDVSQYPEVPKWTIQESSFVFAGIKTAGVIQVLDDKLKENMWKYFAKTSQEILIGNWECKKSGE